MNTSHYKHLAIMNAHNSVCRYRLSAVIVKEGDIISTACNQPFNYDKFTHLYPSFCNTLHAEAAAILRCHHSHRKGPRSLFVARVGVDGLPRLARPCRACMGLIRGHGITEVYYTTNNNWIKEKI